MPQSNLSIASDDRPVIRIASRTHYIERLTMEAVPSPTGNDYQFDDADKLRSLQVPGGIRKSLYGEDGIIDSSKRGERYFFGRWESLLRVRCDNGDIMQPHSSVGDILTIRVCLNETSWALKNKAFLI